MKCKACNKTLSDGEQKFDYRRGTLEDMCSMCLKLALEEYESELLKMSLVVIENDDVLCNKEE